MLGFLTRKRSDIAILADRIDALVEAATASPQESEVSNTTSERLAALETDLQALQLRQEQLAEECLRHLRKASQRMKRAEQYAEDEQLEPVGAVPEPQLPFPEEAEEDDRTWAMNQIRARGEQPI